MKHICESCESEVSDIAIFCRNCGSMFDAKSSKDHWKVESSRSDLPDLVEVNKEFPIEVPSSIFKKLEKGFLKGWDNLIKENPGSEESLEDDTLGSIILLEYDPKNKAFQIASKIFHPYSVWYDTPAEKVKAKGKDWWVYAVLMGN